MKVAEATEPTVIHLRIRSKWLPNYKGGDDSDGKSNISAVISRCPPHRFELDPCSSRWSHVQSHRCFESLPFRLNPDQALLGSVIPSMDPHCGCRR